MQVGFTTDGVANPARGVRGFDGAQKRQYKRSGVDVAATTARRAAP